jgi:diguanylate cyclase (GGDEF)-like protein
MSTLAATETGTLKAGDPAAGPTLRTIAEAGFGAASQLVLDYLNEHMPMGFWSITRVENDRQTYLYLDDNTYGLSRGGSHPWQDSYCVHMVAGTTPRIAPDAQAVPAYASAGVNAAAPIAAYAGAPIAEPDGTLFGAICGIDPEQRPELAGFEPMLNLLSELLSLTLAGDRALHLAEHASTTALTAATTDALTGIHNRRAWDDMITTLDRDFDTYADPTVIVVIDLDNLKAVNDGPGGHAAGDELLRSAAAVMRSNLRDHDFLARLGGDEFGIILTSCPANLAPTLAERINHALDDAEVPASVGWSPLNTAGNAQLAIEMADHAMYQAKARRHAASRPRN